MAGLLTIKYNKIMSIEEIEIIRKALDTEETHQQYGEFVKNAKEFKHLIEYHGK